MNTLKAKVSAVAVLAGILAISQPLYAQGRFHDGASFFGSSFQTARFARKLDLNDEQRKQFREIINAARPEADELADAILANRRALRELGRGTELSEREVQEIADLRGTLVSKMIVLKSRVRGQIYALLTPDQRERFEKMKNRKKRHGHRRYKRS